MIQMDPEMCRKETAQSHRKADRKMEIDADKGRWLVGCGDK